MQKSELKTGMLLEFEGKAKGLLLGNEIFLFRDQNFGGSLSLSHMSSTLHLDNYGPVLAVYKFDTPADNNIGTSLNRFLASMKYTSKVWTRTPSVVEMTMAEVCARFGEDIKILRDRNK